MELDGARGVVGQRELAVVAGVVEAAVHPARQVEGYVLVAAPVVDTLPVLVLQLERLAAEVHLAKPFARAHEAFVCLALEADGSPFCRVCYG